MKRAILCFVIPFTLLFSMGCATEKKVTSSRETVDIIVETNIYQTIDEIQDRSDAIVIASFEEEPAEQYEKDDGTGMELYASRYSLHVEKVLKGEVVEGRDITFLQLGKLDSDDYETKIKKGKKYLLFLHKKDFKEEDIYDATGMEQGIIEIKEHNKLYSYADEGSIMKTFDGKDLNNILNEISK